MVVIIELMTKRRPATRRIVIMTNLLKVQALLVNIRPLNTALVPGVFRHLPRGPTDIPRNQEETDALLVRATKTGLRPSHRRFEVSGDAIGKQSGVIIS